MSDEEALAPEEEDRVLAAEYVLSLLDPAQSAAVETRMMRDPALRAMVAAWAEDFVAMTDHVAEERVPAHVWRAITERLWQTDAPRRSFWRRLGLGELVLGTAAAAVVAFFLYQTDMLAPLPAPEFVASIGAADAPVHFDAAYDSDTGQLTLARLGQDAATGRSYELWLIAGGNAPVSVMVWPAAATQQVIPLPAALADALPGATLAISDEPLGGSPTGQPTGAVLAAGQVTSS